MNEADKCKVAYSTGVDDPIAQLPSRSPLWLVTQRPLINAFVSYLNTQRQALEATPTKVQRFDFERQALEAVRADFASMIQEGEARLHRLGGLVANALFSERFDLKSVVVGEVPSTKLRFEYAQSISPSALYAETDLALGNRILSQMHFGAHEHAETATLVANFVEYQPTALNRFAVHKMTTRIKAEEELWNKVCDELFSLDTLVARDKELRNLSRYVKDVFGLKIVVGKPEDAQGLQETLSALNFTPAELEHVGAPTDSTCQALSFMEVKNYLVDGHNKQSGWEALKSVVKWWDGLFEIQIQPLSNYFREREKLTRESHSAFKANRESIRNRLAQNYPLMGYYRDLLRWLFVDPEDTPPHHPNVEIHLDGRRYA
jgi:hypothetical protein